MRRSLLATATATAAAAAAVLAGCGVGASSGSAPTVTVTRTAETEVVGEPTEAPTDDVVVDTAEPTEVDVPTDEPTEDNSEEVDLFADNSVESEAAAPGTELPVGSYRVTLADVDLDATEDVLGNELWNDDPVNGTYAVLGLSVEYVGSSEGDPGFDLSMHVNGTDGVQYDDLSCNATLRHGVYDAPTLNNGGEAEFDICVDAPAEALSGGATFVVEDSLDFSGAPGAEWALD